MSTPEDDRNTSALRYAGFWPRLGSLLLDGIILQPWIWLYDWMSPKFRLYEVYDFVPGLLFTLFFFIYLVRRFGGTPGKLIVGIRIRKLDGEPVGYREAILRNLPDLILCTLLSLAIAISVWRMTDAEFYSFASSARLRHLVDHVPFWYTPVVWIQDAWICSEFIVLLTNRQRRAIQDFIAGTVVIHTSPKNPPPEIVDSPAQA